MLLNCEKKITRIDKYVASKIETPRKPMKTGTLIGPPPIPKKVEMIDNKTPITIIESFDSKTGNFSMYKCLKTTKINNKIKIKVWIKETTLSLLKADKKILKILFPITPPMTDPMIKYKYWVLYNFRSALVRLYNVLKAIKKTVIDDSTLMLNASSGLKACNNGFIITPPPNPTSDPITVANNAINK